MGLKHLKRRVETIELSDGDSFTVRGLDIFDIMKLATEHRASLALFFDKFKDAGDDRGMEALLADSPALIAAAFNTMPQVAVQIIGMGCGEDDLDLVRALPLTSQIEAIEQIVTLTFATSSPKKIMETIMRVMKGVTAAISQP